MARQYKLRLGDGTVLAVDDQGLRTWALDDKAMVQPAGSSEWRPLKEVLAASRPPRPDDGVAVIPLKPLDGEQAPPPAGSLPALRLAHAEEEWGDEEVYEGGGVFTLAWLWLRRAVLLAALVAGGYVAATTWPTWLPVVTRLGLIVFTKVDERVHPRPPASPGGRREAAGSTGSAGGSHPTASPPRPRDHPAPALQQRVEHPRPAGGLQPRIFRREERFSGPDAAGGGGAEGDRGRSGGHPPPRRPGAPPRLRAGPRPARHAALGGPRRAGRLRARDPRAPPRPPRAPAGAARQGRRGGAGAGPLLTPRASPADS